MLWSHLGSLMVAIPHSTTHPWLPILLPGSGSCVRHCKVSSWSTPEPRVWGQGPGARQRDRPHGAGPASSDHEDRHLGRPQGLQGCGVCSATGEIGAPLLNLEVLQPCALGV